MAAKGMVAASLYEGQVGAAVAGAGEDVVGGTEVEMEMEAAVGGGGIRGGGGGAWGMSAGMNGGAAGGGG